MDEIEEILGIVKNGKGAVEYQIVPEMMNWMGEAGKKWLHQICK